MDNFHLEKNLKFYNPFPPAKAGTLPLFKGEGVKKFNPLFLTHNLFFKDIHTSSPPQLGKRVGGVPPSAPRHQVWSADIQHPIHGIQGVVVGTLRPGDPLLLKGA